MCQEILDYLSLFTDVGPGDTVHSETPSHPVNLVLEAFKEGEAAATRERLHSFLEDACRVTGHEFRRADIPDPWMKLCVWFVLAVARQGDQELQHGLRSLKASAG